MITIICILLQISHHFQLSTSFLSIQPPHIKAPRRHRFHLGSPWERFASNQDNEKSNTDPLFQQRSRSWIVLVDDEESIRLAVGNYLYDAGYTVTACADAEALLELLTSASTGSIDKMPTKLPSVIVSDIRMPGTGMNGLELLDLLKSPSSKQIVSESSDVEFVRSQWRRIPVILLSAKSFTQDRIEGFRKGADVYLPKPFDPAELLSIIDNLIRRMKALRGEDNGKTLRDVKADIIDIKALLKSSVNDNNKESGSLSVRENNGKISKDQQRMLSPKSTYNQGRSSAIVPRKKAGEKSMYQSEIDELGSQVELTDIEEDVLVLLCEGNTNGEIGKRIGLSSVRVSRIVSRMYSKTFIKTRTELVRWAIKMGYVSAK